MAAPIMPPGERRDCRCPKVRHEHGTVGAYNRDGCRCVLCRAAARARRAGNYRRASVNRWHGRAEIVDATGTRRRLQALAALGHSGAAVGALMGCGEGFVVQLRAHEGAVYRSTAERVAVVYERLSATVPVGQYADLARANARRRGWAPPLAWDDESIDDPAASPAADELDGGPLLDEVAIREALLGRPVALTQDEEWEAIRSGQERGLTGKVIAERLGITDRQVWRVLAAQASKAAA